MNNTVYLFVFKEIITDMLLYWMLIGSYNSRHMGRPASNRSPTSTLHVTYLSTAALSSIHSLVPLQTGWHSAEFGCSPIQ